MLTKIFQIVIQRLFDKMKIFENKYFQLFFTAFIESIRIPYINGIIYNVVFTLLYDLFLIKFLRKVYTTKNSNENFILN